MASGFIKAELSTCRHGRPQVSCRLLYKSVFILVFGLIIWKWMNGVDSLGSNQECRTGYKHSHSRVSQCLASIRKLGNRRSSEGLRSFKPPKETNLFILIILAGDIEMNPGPRFQCGLCKKYCKASDRLLDCEECEKRFHASCSNLGDKRQKRQKKKLVLLAFLDFHQPHVVAIQETKIDSSVATSELFPETCPDSVYRKDRNIHGSGVMLLVHKDISHMPITELENDSESIWVKVFANKTSHFVAS